MSVAVFNSNRARAQWRDILDVATAGISDVVIERYGKRVVAVIAYDDYVAVQDELDELRAARRVEAIYEEWKRDPSIARPYTEFRAELVAEGVLNDHDRTSLGDPPDPASREGSA
ncbi:hypothetical protein ACFLYD_04035 [Chloroflexota bacterium]